ncbi:DUF1810 domain-containing protein [Sphingomonas sp. BT552]|uniref:DUF1810 domain-containing protein n=1 Tax=Sphingomonas longa TaxID=2778730 RepID=A0ABS2DDN4_9SPHN|nr:DUF1810 domain-containing protein [Microvirga sp. SRT01]MBM6578174.1 DUF1810 domain-containing protein [Sphingomonas sp. BT552]
MDLSRFIDAQARSWPTAIAEVTAGRKCSHWMWWIFPQIAGLGRSETARHYAIASADEARAYLADPLLGSRLIEATRAAITASGSAETIFGSIDAMKLRSSLTLFEAVAADSQKAVFTAGLDRFYSGERDRATLDLLK